MSSQEKTLKNIVKHDFLTKGYQITPITCAISNLYKNGDILSEFEV